jgi:hypothetical protein
MMIMEYLNEKLEELKDAEKAEEELKDFFSDLRMKYQPKAFVECLEEMRGDVTQEQLSYLKSMEPRKETLYKTFPWMKEMNLSKNDEQLAIGLWMGPEGWENYDKKIFDIPFSDYRYRKKWDKLVEERARKEYDDAIEERESIDGERESEKARAGFDLTYHIARALAGLGEAEVDELEKQYTFYISGLPVNVGEFNIIPANVGETQIANFCKAESTEEIVDFMTTSIPNTMKKIFDDDRLYGDLRRFVMPIYKGDEIVASVNVLRDGNLGKVYEPKEEKTYENPMEFVKEFKEKMKSAA